LISGFIPWRHPTTRLEAMLPPGVFSKSLVSVKIPRVILLALLPLPLWGQSAPTISSIPPRSTVESTVSSATFFTIGDAETAAGDLGLSAVSADPSLVPNANISFGGSGTSRSVTITPASGQRGSTSITVTVTDGDLMTASSTFVFTVLPRYALPAETIPAIVMTEDTSLTLYYRMGNASWTPSVTRTNATLFRTVGTSSTHDLRLQDSGADRRLRLRPAPAIYGTSEVTITITGDAGGPTQSTFQVTVVPKAVADNLLGVPGRTSTFDVLRNDTKPQPATSIALQSFTQPAHGTLVEGSVPGTLRYTPVSGFTGNDTFTYTSIYHTGDTATATGYITVQNHRQLDAKHLDIRMNYVNGAWSNETHTDLSFGTPEAGGSSNPTILDFDESLMMANPASLYTLPGSVDPVLYNFIGVPPGATLWNLPSASKAGVLWPGISTESIAIGTFASYTPVGDWRAVAQTDWIRFEMVGYRIPENAVFSVWDGGGPNGNPRVWFDSIDGINGPNEAARGANPSDTFWIDVNTHAHMNWMFTHPGHYEIDVRSRAFINEGGNLVEVTSPVNTLHFMVYGTGDPSTLETLAEVPPSLGNDAATVDANVSATMIPVLANDRSSPDALEELTITSLTQPAHGSATLQSGTVSYQPANGFAGADAFTYTVADEHGGTATANVQVTVLPQTLAAWRQKHFGTPANLGDAANDEDPDDDGIANLVEYAFQLDPAASSIHQLPQAGLSAGNLEMSFTPPSAVTGITWGAEWSPSLAADDWQEIPNTGNAPLHLYQISVNGKERAFIRIKVSEQ
jgi:surface-anchored protein